MKVISNGENIRAICREIKNLKNLKSAFVIQYFDSFSLNDITYIITELCSVSISDS
jgi:serine/threonine protein kinase